MILHTAAQRYACVTIAESKVACANPESPEPLARGDRVVKSQVYSSYVSILLAQNCPLWEIQGNKILPAVGQGDVEFWGVFEWAE